MDTWLHLLSDIIPGLFFKVCIVLDPWLLFYLALVTYIFIFVNYKNRTRVEYLILMLKLII